MIKDKKVNFIGPMPVNKDLIDKELYSIIVDGGQNHPISFKNSFSIGDNDSSFTSLDLKLPREKDYSDLKFALEHIPKDSIYADLHGFIGGRYDHQLIVYSELSEYLKENGPKRFDLYNEKSHILSISNLRKEQINYTGEFTLFSFYSQRIKLNGDIKYKIEGEYTQNFQALSSRGLSNISYSRIEIEYESPILIFYNA